MISIIIPAYNEEKYLANTLESIKKQDFKHYEIIVVCNGCTDKTFSIAKKFTSKVFELKEKNVSRAKNLGASNAKYKKLVFLDADTIMYLGLLKGTDELLSKGRFFGACKGKGKGLKNKIYFGFKNLVNKFRPWSHGFVFCDKKSFFEAGCFNENLTRGELRDFFNRAEGRYKRVNAYVETSDRRIKNWGVFKLIKYWLFDKNKKDYDAVR
ncbi:glycosyltransferase [Candidatus Woesearchaeota archaeon]|nr:glycosyltransferase [Candidatus Woesearchaeota archaeon]